MNEEMKSHEKENQEPSPGKKPINLRANAMPTNGCSRRIDGKLKTRDETQMRL